MGAEGYRQVRMDSRGVWRTSTMLERGVYKYRFVIDGEWSSDSDASSIPSPFGGENWVRLVA